MIKDNEAKIKEYEKEIQQVKIREKKMANNTRKKQRQQQKPQIIRNIA